VNSRDKIKRIINLLQDRLQADNPNPAWGYASTSAPDVEALSHGETLFECVFNATNKAVVGTRAIAILKYDVVEAIYVGEDAVNLYWMIKAKLEGTTILAAFEADLTNLP
jgi:hypothetical protein